jgi:nucleoside-diphosphate-sugar epimerase
MKVLITGGAGYLGSIMTPFLLSKDFEVTVIDNLMFNQTTLLDVFANPKFRFIRGDIRDETMMKEEINKHDVIIPLAAIVGAPACKRDPDLARQTNYEAPKMMMSQFSSNQIIIFPVTNSGYGIGQKDKYCDESTPLNPISDYGRTKVEIEKMLLNTGNSVTFRLATVFGASPRMRIDLLVNDFVLRAFSDRFVVLFESHFKRNYIHIRDVANAFLMGIEKFETMKGEPYNVGLSDANLSKMELCLKIKEHLPDFHIMESEIGQDPDKRDYIVSNAKVESLGFKPQFSLDMGIQELISTYSLLKIKNFTNV